MGFVARRMRYRRSRIIHNLYRLPGETVQIYLAGLAIQDAQAHPVFRKDGRSVQIFDFVVSHAIKYCAQQVNIF